jgi:hypothetical protein
MSGAQYGAEIDYRIILMVYCVLFIYMFKQKTKNEIPNKNKKD